MRAPSRTGPWVIVAPAPALRRLRGLLELRGRGQDVVVHERGVPSLADWPALLPAGARGVLLAGDPRRSPRTALPGLFVPDGAGVPVPVGWLPVRADLSSFAGSVTALAMRREPSPVAILGQRSPRYQRLGERMLHHLGDVPALRWGAERLTREDLVHGLSAGLGIAVYLGHGRPSGWAAYRGLRAADLGPVVAEPLGCLLSVTCWTASRHQVATSFCESVVLAGVAVAAVGAIRPVEHLASTRVVLSLARGLARRPATVGELLRAAFLDRGVPAPEAADFRLCGDPSAPLAAAPAAGARAAAVFAPPPEYRPLTTARPQEVA